MPQTAAQRSAKYRRLHPARSKASNREGQQRYRNAAKAKNPIIHYPDLPADQAGALCEWARDKLKIPPGHPASGQAFDIPDYGQKFIKDALAEGVHDSILCTGRKNSKTGISATIVLGHLGNGPLARPGFRAGLSPIVLSQMVRDIIRVGESVWQLEIRGGQIRLSPCGSWSMTGDENPETWAYQVTRNGPSRARTRVLMADEVVQARYAFDPARPWAGKSPLSFGADTASLAASLEQRLAGEASGPSGYVVPVPSNAEDLADLATDMAQLHGNTSFVESFKPGGGDMGQSPAKDWQAERFGIDPPEMLGKLRDDAGMSVLNICGIPSTLGSPNSDGTAAREAWRRLLFGSCLPIAKIITTELRAKIDPDISISLDAIRASDLSGRARAFQSLTRGGLPIDQSAALSGLLEDDE